MNQRHKDDRDNLEKSNNDELNKFNNFWNQRLREFEEMADKMTKDLKLKHQTEQQDTRNNMERQLSKKVK